MLPDRRHSDSGNFRISFILFLIFLFLSGAIAEASDVSSQTDTVRIKIEPLWKRESFFSNSEYQGLFFNDGKLYLKRKTTNSSILTCINPTDGKDIWKSKILDSRDTIFTRDYIVNALVSRIQVIRKSNGSVCRLRNLKYQYLDIFTASEKGSMIFFNGFEKRNTVITAYDFWEGKTIWKKPVKELTKGMLEQLFPDNCIFFRGRLFIGANNCFIILSAVNGDLLKCHIPETWCSFQMTPVFDKENNLYTASTIFCFHDSDEIFSQIGNISKPEGYSLTKFDNEFQKKWEVKISPAASNPTLYGNRIFIVTMDEEDYRNRATVPMHHRLCCFDSNTGRKIWEYRFDNTIPSSALQLNENRIHCYKGLVFYCSGFDGLFVFDADKGNMLKAITTGNITDEDRMQWLSPPPYSFVSDKDTIYLYGHFNNDDKSKPGKKEKQILEAFRVYKVDRP